MARRTLANSSKNSLMYILPTKVSLVYVSICSAYNNIGVRDLIEEIFGVGIQFWCSEDREHGTRYGMIRHSDFILLLDNMMGLKNIAACGSCLT